MLAYEAAAEQDPEPIVREVAEPTTGSFHLLDQQVRGLDRAIRGAGRVVGEDLVPPSTQGLRESEKFGAGFGRRAPSDRIVERVLRDDMVVGEVDVTDFLFRDPTVLELPVGVSVTQRGPDPFPTGLVDTFGTEEKQFAGRIERVTCPTTVTERVLLDALTTSGNGHVRETHDVERIDYQRYVGQQDRVGDRFAVALVWINRDDLDPSPPRCGHLREPKSQVNGVATFEHIDDLTRGDVHDGSNEPASASPMCGLHHGLIETDHRRLTDPVRIVDPIRSDAFDRGPDRRPRHAEPSGDRRDGPLDRSDPVRGPYHGTVREHPTRSGKLAMLSPRPGGTVQVGT